MSEPTNVGRDRPILPKATGLRKTTTEREAVDSHETLGRQSAASARRKARARRNVMTARDALAEREALASHTISGTFLFSEAEFSKREAFLSGAALVLGVSARPLSHRLRVYRPREDPWSVVGQCLVRSLKVVVGNDPSLPPLPDNLHSMPESPNQRDVIDQSSV